MIEEDRKVKFCIPPLGTEIVLADTWCFEIFSEYRNLKFIQKYQEHVGGVNDKLLENSNSYSHQIHSAHITLPKGSHLKLSRIYIRQGKGEYDSVTFSLQKVTGYPNLKGRFWVKLKDVNKIVCYPLGEKMDIDMSFGFIDIKPDKEFKFIEI